MSEKLISRKKKILFFPRRLDFAFFDITETTAGVCTDSFAVTTPTGRDPSTICGTNTGQHSKFFL